MGYYAYKGTDPLGQEPLGTAGKFIDNKSKTPRGPLNRIKSLGWTNYRLYSFTNFYDVRTFKLL